MWHHVVLAQNGTNQKMYVDGVLINSHTTTNTCDTSDYTETYFGAGLVTTSSWPARPTNAWGYFNGSIAEAAEYSRPLGAAEAAAHYRARTALGRLATITKPGLVAAANVKYDQASERVTEYTDADGAVWLYGAPTVTSTVDSDDNTIWRTKVAVTDPIGQDTVYPYDPTRGGRLVAVTDPVERLGRSVTYTYDDRGFLFSVTDPDGNPTEYGYDERGNMISRTTQHGSVPQFTEYWSYFANPADPLDPRNDQVTHHRNARSTSNTDSTYLTRYIHSSAGKVVQIQAPGATTGLQLITNMSYTTGTETAADGNGTMPPGLLLQVTEPGNRITKYSYTAAGDLAWTIDPAGQRTDYGYDGIGRTTSSTVAASAGASAATTTYRHDGASRVVEQFDPEVANEITSAAQQLHTVHIYNGNGWLTSTTVSDTKKTGSERATTYGYDSRGRRDTVTDPEGGIEKVTYNEFGKVKTRTDAAGTNYSYSYVPTHTGWQLYETIVLGWNGGETFCGADQAVCDWTLESRGYDPRGHLALKTDAMGNKLRYQYYEDNRHAATFLKNYKDPATGQTRELELEWIGYLGSGERYWTREGEGRRSQWLFYDPAGRLTETSDRDGMWTVQRAEKRGYDNTPFPTQIRLHNPDGTLVSQSNLGYDPLGRETRREDYLTTATTPATTAVTTMERDARGLVTRVVDPRGNVTSATADAFATNFAYDAIGRNVRVTAPSVSVESGGDAAAVTRPVTRTGYNAFSETTETQDANGKITTTVFDKASRPVAQTLPEYVAPGATAPTVATNRWEYNAASWVTKQTDPAGNATTFGYDELGNQRLQVDPSVAVGSPGGVTEITYTPSGQPLSVTDPTGSRTEATYDQFGRQVTATVVERTPSLQYLTTAFDYDLLGNVTSATAPSGAKTTVGYDALSNPVTVTDPAGVLTSSTFDVRGNVLRVSHPDTAIRKYVYDMAGRVTATRDEDAGGALLREQSSGYDLVGNPTDSTDTEGAATVSKFDALNRLVEITRPVSTDKSIATSYGYDAAGNITRATDGNGNKTVFTANAWNLPESTIEPATTQHPAAADRTYTASYDLRGLMTSLTKPGGVAITSFYDALGRLTKQTGTGAAVATPNREYSYDLAGRMTRASAPGGDNVYTYNDRGLTVSATGPSCDSSFTWTNDGNMATATTAAGTANYAYMKGRLASAADPITGSTVAYDYDPAGRLASVGVAGGAVREYRYDTFGRPDTDTVKKPGGTVSASVDYGYDKADRLKSKTTTGFAAAMANNYWYDQAGRLTSWNNGSTTASYDWDDAGNLVNKAGVAQTFNERNQVIKSGTSTLTYTPRGTLSSITTDGAAASLTYNAFDELVAADNASYTYDGLNRLISRGSTTLSYLGATREIGSTGAWKYSYASGGDLLGASDGITSGLAVTDQHTDLVGQYDPSAGALGGSRNFDPFGNVVGATGAQPHLGFQHQYTDPATGLTNMGTRWYGRGTGTFASRDTFALDPRDVGNANRYGYVAGSPLNHTDMEGGYCDKPRPCTISGTTTSTGSSWWGRVGGFLGRLAGGAAGVVVGFLFGPAGVAGGPDSMCVCGPIPGGTPTPVKIPGTAHADPRYIPQSGGSGATVATTGGGGGGYICDAACKERIRQEQRRLRIEKDATTKAERPDDHITVKEATAGLWEAALKDLIHLGVLRGEEDGRVYVPDAVDQVIVGQAELPPSARVLFSDGKCTIGKTWSSVDGYTYNSHTEYVGACEQTEADGGLNLYKFKDPTSLRPTGWREGDYLLAPKWQGSAKATWKHNSSLLRREMAKRKPIFETYVDAAGNYIPTKGFLNMERNVLINRGWTYDPSIRAWVP